MKTRFNGLDIICALKQIKNLIGFRVIQIYDVDNKTYLLKLQNNDEKSVLLFESGTRIHTTNFEWPKSNSPSGFTMKLRKHLKNKRLEGVRQLGIDRIIDLEFGSGEACYHVIIELYDRGNILLTDNTLTILNVLRPHTEGEDMRFAVREVYPVDTRARNNDAPSMEDLKLIIKSAKPGDSLKTILNPILPCGPPLIEHFLSIYDIHSCKIAGEVVENDVETTEEGGKKPKKKKNKRAQKDEKNMRDFEIESDLPLLVNAINDIYSLMNKAKEEDSPGFIIQKKEIKPSMKGDKGESFFYSNIEFHPFLYRQFEREPVKEFPTFLQAVDEFFSQLESQKIDLKVLAQEKDALKKLSNVRNDHQNRLNELAKNQLTDRQKAELITRNQLLVDSSIQAIGNLLAKQNSWEEIEEFIKDRRENKDPLALAIRKLKFETNHITLHLTDPYAASSDEDDEREEDEEKLPAAMDVDVDLSLTAYANATRYYEQKRTAAKKSQKTIEATSKALKSAERKTLQTLKDVKVQATITKVRKTYWFEKFYWFISSENYLIIGGRDQQQNELLVKKHLKANDIYVHAEIQGASSIIIKNPTGEPIPPKTLLEAGTNAVCFSVAWDAKVVCSTYWVYAHQVSKTAPTGEYLTTGSFMIRGKKNFLPPSHLILGLGFLFKLEESSVERHRGERRVRNVNDDDASSIFSSETQELESIHEDQEIQVSDDDGEESDSGSVKENAAATENIIKEEEEEEETEFPDIQIKIAHDTGNVDIQHNPKSEPPKAEQVEETLIEAVPIRKKVVEKKMKPQKKKDKQNQAPIVPVADESRDNKNVRGKKGKMKKIREKYKDQDEEERAMAMEILQSSKKETSAGKKQQEEAEARSEIKKEREAKKKQQNQQKDNDLDEGPAVADETDMLDTLTGHPVEEDELLYAVPVVAPYQTLQNYKFKVKLTPGTGRRGKASKAALQIFLRDKATTTREKELLKAVKEDLLSRNMPGKVKISSAHLMKVKK